MSIHFTARLIQTQSHKYIIMYTTALLTLFQDTGFGMYAHISGGCRSTIQPFSLLICSLRSDFEGGRTYILPPSKSILMPGPSSGKNLISILVTDYIQKKRGQALLFSFKYNLLPNFRKNMSLLPDPCSGKNLISILVTDYIQKRRCKAGKYLQPHYANGVFGNVYL